MFADNITEQTANIIYSHLIATCTMSRASADSKVLSPHNGLEWNLPANSAAVVVVWQ